MDDSGIPLKLALFDIDGTLTDTNHIDCVCFVEALREEFGIDSIDEDWSTYPHTTARAILGELLRRAGSRAPDEAAIAAHRTRFVNLLAERMDSGLAIPGAIEFLRIVQREGWAVVLCTGAWSDSARVKLQRAGFPADLRIASCDTVPSREEIVRQGIAMAGDGPFERMVIFGDASWDVRTARNLDLPFIGIASGRRAQRLQAEGAETVIPDYSSATEVLRLMEEARAPR